MAIIYSYPKVTSPLATDVLVLTDTTLTAGKRKNKTKSLAMSDLAAYVVSSTSGITGGGTFNTIPLWTPDGFKLGDSIITQAASGQGITVTGGLDVTEDLNVTGSTELFSTLEVQGASTFSNVSFQGVVFDGGGNPGTQGQVLSSTGTQTEWVDVSGTVTGTGTTNTLPIWTDGPSSVLGDSPIKLGTGTDSLILGAGTSAIGNYSVATGSGTTASANNSFAGGLSTLASGLRSFAMGGSTIASGFMSAAFGFETVASGTRSFAFGDTTTASGEFSLAHGKGSIASGNYSTTMGVLTVASGERSFAIGDETTASGDFSVSFGKDTTAGAYGQMVIGQSNTIDAGESATVFSSTSRVFVIGNGTVSNPADAFTVKYNGNITAHAKLSVGKPVLTSEPTYDLEVFGEAMFKSNDGENRVFIGNEGDAPNDSGLIELYDETGALDIKLVGKGNSFIKTGRLGLGFDTTPAYQLEVDSGSADIVARFKSTDTKAAIVVSDVDTDAYMTAAGGFAYFGRGTTSNSIAVDNSGALGINTGVNAIEPSALLEINSTTKGFLPPRGTTTNINDITAPAEGLVVYNTTLKTLCFYNGTGWQKVNHANM
jgi:hypothetical protein